MKKRIAILLVAGAALLGMVCFLLARRRPFPMWERAEEKRTNDDVSVSFVALTQDGEYDHITVTLQSEQDEYFYVGNRYEFSVEYLQAGVWYTVYERGGGPSVDIECAPHIAHTCSYAVPSGLLDTPGTYRIYLDSVGYCEIGIGNEAL